jgi:hypothetical protein
MVHYTDGRKIFAAVTLTRENDFAADVEIRFFPANVTAVIKVFSIRYVISIRYLKCELCELSK